MPKFTDLLISALIKKGILYEARNVDTNVIIPSNGILPNACEESSTISVNIKADHVKISFTDRQDI